MVSAWSVGVSGRGSGFPLTVRGGLRSNTSVTASAGRVGSPAATDAAVASMDSCSGRVLMGGPGVSANGNWSNTSPSLGCRSQTMTEVGTSGSSHSSTATEPNARRSGSSASPAGAGGS